MRGREGRSDRVKGLLTRGFRQIRGSRESGLKEPERPSSSPLHILERKYSKLTGKENLGVSPYVPFDVGIREIEVFQSTRLTERKAPRQPTALSPIG